MTRDAAPFRASAGPAADEALVDRVDAALPQTQCTRCGYPDCRAYARAIVHDAAPINRCPPGGAEGIDRLAAITGRAPRGLDPECGVEAPRTLALIDESWCIGCTLCIDACPVDSILGATKRMHVVIEAECTGCELCVPVCPVDCIELRPAQDPPGETLATGWSGWSAGRAQRARARYQARARRLEREGVERSARLAARADAKLADLAAASRLTDPAQLERKRAVVAEAMARARRRLAPVPPPERRDGVAPGEG